MQLLKRVKWVYVLLSLFLIGLGVCLFLWPDIPSVTICCAVGGGAVLFGIIKIVFYFLRELEAMDEHYDFAIGAMCVIAGVILLIHPTAVLELIPQVLGVCMLVDCMFKLQIALDAKRLGNKGWWLALIVTLLCIVWGCLLIWQPFGLEQYSAILIAAGLIADGVQNLVGVIYIAATVKKTEAMGKEITEPVDNLTPPVFAAPDTPAPIVTPAIEPVPVPAETAVAVEPIAAESVSPPEPAPAKPAKKKFSLFGQKSQTASADSEPPLTPPDFSHLAEDIEAEEDGAVAEIHFDMNEEGDRNNEQDLQG